MAAKKWKFSNAQEHFKVQFGDVWRMTDTRDQTHVLMCGDLEHDEGLHLLKLHGPAQLVYTDPPWGRNLASSFRTQAGAEGPADYIEVLRRVARVGEACGVGYFEMSVRDTPMLKALLIDTGANIFGEWGITYSQNRPCRLLGATWGKVVAPFGSPEGMTDFADGSPLWALGASPWAGTVCDPCTGLGTTLKAAVAAGRRFIGLELNPARVAEVLKWAQLHAGMTVHKEDA